MKSKVHIVPHMHWDREWYFSAEQSKILLIDDMEQILNFLEQNNEYPFYVLDGQTSVLEDYLNLVPKNKDRIKNLVQSGKLLIGPWYTQTDEMVVGGESIVRNLLYGLKDCKEFGEPMMIGYLPDSFGQSASMPQILNGFDIKRFIFWRGTSERMGTNKTEFIWKGDNNSEVVTVLMPLGYAIGKYLPTDLQNLKSRLDKYLPVLDRGATTDNILLPNGHDQMPIQKNIFDIIKNLKKCYPDRDFFLSKYENLFEQIEQITLPKLYGEFLDGKYMRVHRSIYSTRADLKSLNTLLENKITNLLEPLASIAHTLSFEYYDGAMQSIWKELMKNHAHDSIGCCCSDKVHKEIKSRFLLVHEKVEQLILYYMRKIVDAMPLDIALDKLTVFNLLPYERDCIIHGYVITKMTSFKLVDKNNNDIDYKITNTEIIDAGLIDRQIVHYGDYEPFIKYTIALKDIVPAIGYKTYFIKQSDIKKDICSKKVDLNIIQNEFYKICINPNGTLDIFDKQSQQKYFDVLLVEDGSDDGDEYDYSPLEDDFIITSKNAQADISIIDNDLYQIATIKYKLNIPMDLTKRLEHFLDSSLDIKFEIKLSKHNKVIEVNACIKNNAYDHRVRVLLPSNIGSKFSISDNQFGKIRRNTYDTAMDVWKKEKWSERPDGIYPFLSYVTLDNANAIAVVTNSVREYEIIGDNYDTIAITLFRSVGVLGKENLVRRPGRPSGIKMMTPDSQMIGTFSFDFGITANTEQLSKIAKEYLTPIITYNKMPHDAMKLNRCDFNTPYDYSIFSEQFNDAILSVVKKAEYKNGLIVRFYNPKDKDIKLCIDTIFKNINLSKLNEDILEKLDEDIINLAPNEIKTLYLS